MVLEKIIENDLLLFIAIIPYWLAWAALLKMALNSHTDKVHKKNSQVYPNSYFFWLTVQLVPLLLAGIARGDSFIISTRAPLLLCVFLAIAMIKDDDGIFEWKEYRVPLMSTLIFLSFFSMIWNMFPVVSNFITSQKLLLGYIALAGMILHLLFGQGSTILKLWKRYRSNKPRMQGLGLQMWRFSGFFIPSIHYGLAFGLTDALFLQSVVGSIGALIMIVLYKISRPDYSKWTQ